MQHSASSIALAERCPRAWWLRYRAKLKPPELTWRQAKRAKARGDRLPAGVYSKALGTEVHRLAEIYLTVPSERAARLIEWSDLPGQCLHALVPLLPPAGSVSRRDVEAAFSVVVAGVRFRGKIDVLAGAQVWDHKTSRDIRTYALLPHSVSERLRQPKRSLRDDLQACLYALYWAQRSRTSGALCRWNYTETQRARRALPVVQYVPRMHAISVAERAARVAKRVEGFREIDDAAPDTTACHQYGGCWYRSEGHCRVPRKLGAVMAQITKEKEEQDMAGKLNFKALGKATEKANEAEEAKAKVAKKLASPPPEDEDADVDADEEDEDAEEEAPPPKRMAKKAGKQRPSARVRDEEAADSEEDEEPAAPAKPTTTERERLAAATAAPDEILRYFRPGAGAKGEAKILATAFNELAQHLADNLPRNPERAQCLRKLLEASDCAARAVAGEA